MRAGAPDSRRVRNPKPMAVAADGSELPPAWNGERCQARRCVVQVAGEEHFADWPKHWALGLAGRERRAVEVVYGEQTFYLDDEALEVSDRNPVEWEHVLAMGVPEGHLAVGYLGWGWAKVTLGRGGPGWGHRDVPVVGVVRYLANDGGELEGTDGDGDVQ